MPCAMAAQVHPSMPAYAGWRQALDCPSNGKPLSFGALFRLVPVLHRASDQQPGAQPLWGLVTTSSSGDALWLAPVSEMPGVETTWFRQHYCVRRRWFECHLDTCHYPLSQPPVSSFIHLEPLLLVRNCRRLSQVPMTQPNLAECGQSVGRRRSSRLTADRGFRLSL